MQRIIFLKLDIYPPLEINFSDTRNPSNSLSNLFISTKDYK